MGSVVRRGTTLIELLVAVVFLAVCVTAVLNCVSGTQIRTSFIKRRALALALAQNTLDDTENSAVATTLSVGTSETTPTQSGMPQGLTLRKTVSLVAGYTNLYSVQIVVIWPELINGSESNQRVQLQTYVRSPDV